MEPIVTALWNVVSKSIRLTHFVKELPHKIRRFAYCCRLRTLLLASLSGIQVHLVVPEIIQCDIL